MAPTILADAPIKPTSFKAVQRRYARAQRALDKLADRQAALRAELNAIAAEARPICPHPLEYRPKRSTARVAPSR